MKACRKCSEEKELDLFYKNGGGRSGYRNTCKRCLSDIKKANRTKNLDGVRAKEKEYRLKKGLIENKRIAEWRKANPQKAKAIAKKHYYLHHEKNKKDRYTYQQKRIKEDINYKLAVVLRKRLCTAIRINSKVGSAVNDLGCSIEELKKHLEAQFQPGMSWDNWSLKGWHIDHIKPLASFDLTDRNQFLEACHYSNLQPMWAEENFSKGAKII